MEIRSIKLKNTVIPGNIFLAPLAGATDVGFREVCRISGAHLSFTEMVSVKGLHYNNANTHRLLKRSASENPSAVQLFGSCPELFYRAVQSPALEGFDIIDINMGCPVPKVVNNGEGSALMQDLKAASAVIKASVRGTDRPVTVKFRKGFDQKNINAVDFAKLCQDSGAALITVHGRLRSEYYSGKSDADIIAKVKHAVSIPVIANGDIFCKEDAARLMDTTGADGVMIARGCLGNPAIFSHLTGKPPLSVYHAIMLHAKTLCAFAGQRFTVLNMRKHLLWYLARIAGAKPLKVEAAKIDSFAELESFCQRVFGDIKP